ncbi:MAG: M23 family metallopeptidase, partial [Ruminococcaceae bacterium]|nr:M23 family metallopeptidase [Oscillospiraceae bacterium]
MANKRWDAVRGSIGFYATMTFCLLAIAVSGYFLLSDREPSPPQDFYEDVPGTEIVMPEVSPTGTTEVPPVEVDLPTAELLPEPEPIPEPKPVSAPTSIPDTAPVVAEPPRLVVSPLKGEVLAAFSVDDLIYSETMEDWRTHDGVDIAAAIGTTVMAASAGTVAAVFNDSMMGTTVVLEHSG